MDELNNYTVEDGNEIKYRKKKLIIVILGILLIFFIPFLAFIICNIIDALINDKINFNMEGAYFILIFLGIMIFIFVETFIAYFGNKIIVSESFITIKRAVFGKKYVIARKCIVSKYGFMVKSNYVIILYLMNGKKISTGRLYCKNDREFNKLYNELPFKPYISRKDYNEEISKLKNIEIADNEVMKKTNYMIPILISIWMSFVFVIFLLLATRFNYNYGPQYNFQLKGTVVYKKIEKNRNGNEYKITLIEDNGPKEYVINVSSNLYEQFCEKNKINITGKKGSLGILYNVKFSKEE